MINEELARANAALAEAGADAALLSSMGNVTYVSGYEVPLPIGASSDFAYGIALALIGKSAEQGHMIVSDGAAGTVNKVSRLGSISTFDSFSADVAFDSQASYVASIRQSLQQAGLANTNATLAIEFRSLPYIVSDLLAREFPKLKLIDAAPALWQARKTKTAREIELLRQASRIADIGHNTLAELARTPGLNEFAMWAQITSNMFRAVGHDVPVVGELVTGPRTNVVRYPDGPRDRVTEYGDAVIMDISQRVNGYWSDCTNSHLIGNPEPNAEQLRYARASQAACEAAMGALKPGNRASDAWQAAEDAFQRHGLSSFHYAGHQIGVVVNEPPRLVSYDDTPIEVGMVFSVEPGAYTGPDGTFGARSEKMVLVTENGPEILSTFSWGI